MNMTMKSILVMVTLILPVSGLAGPRSGGGGFAVSCPATPVSAASLELLDLYEMGAGGHQLQPPLGDFKQEYVRAVSRMNNLLGAPNYVQEQYELIENNLKRFFQSVKWLKNEQELPVAQDLGKKPWIPSQCELKQIAYFDDSSETIYVLEREYYQLSPQHQAALVFHELWFRHHRTLGETTSELSRRLTGFSFVTTRFHSIIQGPFPEESRVLFARETMSSTGSQYSLDQNSISQVFHSKDVVSGKTIFLFKQLFGRSLLAETYALLPAMNLEFEVVWVQKPFQRPVRVLKTPGMNVDVTVPVRGAAVEGLGYEVRVYGQTGSSFYMDLLRNKQVLQTSWVTF